MTDLDAAELVPAGARPIANEPDIDTTSRNGKHPPATPVRDVAPHDLLAERSLLGAAMLGAHAALDEVPDGAFYAPGHGHIANAIRHLAANSVEIDTVTVADRLRRVDLLDTIGGTGTLAEIMATTPATTNAGRYAQIVIGHWRARQLIAAGHEMASVARDHGPDAAYELLRPLLDANAPTTRGDRFRPGSWLLDAPSTPPAIWGRDSEVLWAAGEPCLITGPPGVGKTTLTAQILKARIGLADHVLGWPLETDGAGKVLYLASDRPQQIRRALARVFTHDDRATLDERLTIWAGPPPADLARNTGLLVELAQHAQATTVVLDSLKDMAIGLAEDEVGAGLNQAIQHTIAAGIDVLALHHQRKGTNGAKPKTLEDLYGSTWIAAGAGSVLLLWGKPGDAIVELDHLKQPSTDVGPLKIEHDHNTGTSSVHKGFDLLAFVRHRPNGVTATEAAKAWLEKEKPTDNERRKALRRLDNLTTIGQLHKVQSDTRQADGTMPPARFFAVDRTREPAAQTAIDDPETDPGEPTEEVF